MKNDRGLEIAAFLDQSGWGEALAQPFDGDFSPRRYARLIKTNGDTAILMDADAGQKTPQFISVAALLRKYGIAAPEIYASQPDLGLVLMQDFGRRNVGALLDSGNEARDFYLQAAALLAQLHRGFDRTDALDMGLPLFNADLFVLQAELFLDGYFPFIRKREANDEERQDFRAAWRAVLRPVETLPKSLMLRDFMPDNIMSLPGNKLGALDFQDAGVGPIAYDLASLCEEVRRDGGFALLPEVVANYREQAQSPVSQADLLRACVIMSAQRHTRILGIVADQAIKKGRHEKLALLPRITQHLKHIMKEPYLLPVQKWMENFESDAS